MSHSSSSSSSSGGIGFFGALAILFIALKLTGHIDWSWWWVLAPIWMPISAGALFVAACLVTAMTPRRSTLRRAHDALNNFERRQLKDR